MHKEVEKQEDWIQKKWRPMMAMMYMIVCVFDFIVFPIMFTGVQFWEFEAANDAFRQWNPITLGGGGLFHVAMGAVLGVTAWSRGQEKIAGAANNHTNTTEQSVTENTTQIKTKTYERIEPTLYGAAIGTPHNEVVTGYKGKASPNNGPDPLI
jgi:hypothetical protein